MGPADRREFRYAVTNYRKRIRRDAWEAFKDGIRCKAEDNSKRRV